MTGQRHTIVTHGVPIPSGDPVYFPWLNKEWPDTA
jgi:hypothetical protein